MPAVDPLRTLLVEDSRNVAARMAAVGYSEDETQWSMELCPPSGSTERPD